MFFLVSIIVINSFYNSLKSQQLNEESILKLELPVEASIEYFAKDEKGFLWLGTTHSLYFYDGLKVFKISVDTLNSFQFENIQKIIIDPTNRLWVLSNKSISSHQIIYSFQPKINHTADIPITENILIDDIALNSNDELLILSKNILYTYNTNNNILNKHFISNFNIIEPYRLYIDKKNRVWLYGKQGLFLFDQHTKSARLIEDEGEQFSHQHIKDILEIDSNIYVVGTYRGIDSLTIFPDKKEFKITPNAFLKDLGIATGTVSLCKYKSRLIIATNKGLFVQSLNNDFKSNEYLSTHDIKNIYKSKDQYIWYATNKGVFYFDPYLRSTNLQPYSVAYPNPSFNAIKTLKKIQDEYWIGTDGGIVVFDSNFNLKNIYSNQRNANHKIPGKGGITFLDKDQEGNLWAGSWGKGLLLKPINKEDFQLRFKNQKHEYKQIRCGFFNNKKSKIWLGTRGGGVLVFDIERRKTEPVNIDAGKWINHITAQGDSLLWVGSNKGISIYDLDKRRNLKLKNLQDNPYLNSAIYGIDFDDEGNVWCASNEGLICIDMLDKNLNLFTPDLISKSSKLYFLKVINQNQIVCCGPKTIFIFNKERKKFYKYSESLLKEDKYFSWTKIDENLALLGGTDGLKTIDLKFFTENAPLSKPFIFKPDHIISKDEQFISFNFTGINFTKAEWNRFYYRIPELDSSWSDIGYDRVFTMENPGLGKYHFQLKTENYKGQSNKSIASLPFQITYGSNLWIILISGFILFGIVAFYFYSKRLKSESSRKNIRKAPIKKLNFLSEKELIELLQSHNTNILEKDCAAFTLEILNISQKNMAKQDFNINDISKIIGISRSQLFREFKQFIGIPPAEFIRLYRLSHAQKLLSETKLSISEITYDLGFSSPSNFSRLFRKQFNMKPSEFRNKTDKNSSIL